MVKELSTILGGGRTTTTLGANINYVGEAFDTGRSGGALLDMIVFADQAGTVTIEQSFDNITWRERSDVSEAVAANEFRGLSVSSIAYRYVRPKYKNGGVAQGQFELTWAFRIN